MKNLLACIVLINFFFLISATDLTAALDSLKMSSNNRFFVHEDGTPFFPNVDTGWEMPWVLGRTDVETYLQTRKNQKFNTIATVAFGAWEGVGAPNIPNAYGDQPFVIVSGKYDPLQPITTPGNDPNNATEYDYWDHLDHIIDLAESKDQYVILLPAWGKNRVVGGSSDRLFDNLSVAYQYGHWIGDRYKNKKNIIWMMGGDCIPDKYTDYKPNFRKMAEGVADGVNGVNNNDGNADYSTLLISYHPPKWAESSSHYFPSDAYMVFNSTQDQPSDQINRINADYALSPTKATWLFEGGYEGRVKTDGTYGDWQCRFQAYQTVFAGGFGQTYGHMSIWDFDSGAWQSALNDPGANDMQHILALMTSVTDDQFLSRIPDQSLLDGDTGSMTGSEGMFSSCILATRTSNGDNAMIYSANGRNIRVKMSLLAGPTMTARWFDPRSGAWSSAGSDVPSGSGAAIVEFDPPGSVANGNDYILVLGGEVIPPEPVDPYTDNLYNRGLLHCDDVVTNLWPNGTGDCLITSDDNSSGRPAVAPILNTSNNWDIGIDNSTLPTFKTNSPYSGDYLEFDGSDTIRVTNAWHGGDNMDLDLSFRFNGLPPASGDNYAGMFWSYPVKAYLQNTGDDTYGKVMMLVYDAAGNPHFFSSTKVLNPNVWYHLSFSASNNNLQVVVGNDDEGYTTDTSSATGLLAPGDFNNVIIGSDFFVPTRLFQGDLDEIRWGVIIPEPTTLFAVLLLGFSFLRR